MVTWAVGNSRGSEWGTIGGGGNWSSDVAWADGGGVGSTWGVESGAGDVAGSNDWSTVSGGVGSSWGESGSVGSAVSWGVRVVEAHCVFRCFYNFTGSAVFMQNKFTINILRRLIGF